MPDQAAVSGIERGEVSPAVETAERLLAAMGMRLAPEPAPLERDYDPLHLRASLERSPEERLRLAISWNRLAGRLAEEGGHVEAEHRPQPLDAQRILSIDEATVPVAGRDDLIRMKLARGRPVDRADVAALTDPGVD